MNTDSPGHSHHFRRQPGTGAGAGIAHGLGSGLVSLWRWVGLDGGEGGSLKTYLTRCTILEQDSKLCVTTQFLSKFPQIYTLNSHYFGNISMNSGPKGELFGP